MQFKNIILVLSSAILLLGSCSKSLLDTSPDNKYVEGNFWESEAAVDAALTGCYAVLTYSGMYGGEATALWEETASPNAYNYSNSMGFNAIAEGTQEASSEGIIPTRYQNCYAGIGRCNSFLAHAGEVPLDADDYARMRGEVYFLRALYYFNLENYYGGIPLILDPPDVSTQAELPRTDRVEVVNQILKDLDSASSLLPFKYGSADQGRATKGAAMSLKARILLYEASPLLNTDNSKEKWQAAEDAAQAVIDAAPQAGYGLFGNYRSLFLPENENNKEVIFDVQFIYPDLGNSFDLIGRQYNTNAPLLGLAEAYEMDNGLAINNPNSGYDAGDPYKNRDPRLYATIVFPGDTFMGVPVTNTRFSITGYGMKKYTVYDKETASSDVSDLKGGQSYTNFIVLRYADILMMYAEARNEVSGPDDKVLSALNQIRNRAGMPEITGTYTQDSMRNIIHLERRIEFAGEALYYNDIRRWKTAETELNQKIYTYNHSAIETRTFDPARDYWWPIPQVQKDLNPNLEQSAGY
ncbi:Starch-binding associating with outer membrane [Arachidicoccus rhizosphaerae]|uniref:Starch-binding associating with outer membrane n=1 Tax=Arachidicoccus rhizosphaerae TaxID=551991 RepID=A0A1H4C7D3_9BACT|nr:RagB/SusD family nutrient uptake outer membrane protein [Arachidicoccus rhizosphaerae]SEA56294.1 Starch-binding associating with outer membrane [Arachidicoccus rhizosphaerae]